MIEVVTVTGKHIANCMVTTAVELLITGLLAIFTGFASGVTGRIVQIRVYTHSAASGIGGASALIFGLAQLLNYEQHTAQGTVLTMFLGEQATPTQIRECCTTDTLLPGPMALLHC